LVPCLTASVASIDSLVPPSQRERPRTYRIVVVMLICIAALVSMSFAATLQLEPSHVDVFEPGVLSDGEVFRGTFSSDGRTFYFFKRTGTGENYRIFSSVRRGNTWSAPAIVDLGGPFSDLYPAISSDGRRLVFSSYRPVPGHSTSKPNAHLWYAERTDDGWGAPVFMARTSTLGHYHSWAEFGFDGALYFRRTTPDWRRNETMRAAWDGAAFGSPEPYQDVERWKGWRSDVDVVGGAPGPAGRIVFLDVATKNPSTGRGASDIWIAVRQRHGWADPKPLAAGINSDGFDVFPFVSPDGSDLYFVRDFKAFHRIPLALALASVGAAPEIRYIANAGMLVSTPGARFMIDAPIRDGIAPYANSSAAERTLLENARAPYDAVDAILVTHWHEDHFSAEAVAAHLAANTRTLLIASPEVVERVRASAPALPAARLRAVLPAPGRAERIEVGGEPVHVLRLRHNPTRRLPEQHLGFLIGGVTPVLHVGDADPVADNFDVLDGLPAVDVAFLPFWYVSDQTNRRMVETVMRPRRIVAVHAPPRDLEKIGAALRDTRLHVQLASTPATRLTSTR
jgi:L-ascorbate metabolism protein UlaG (beta-lactamase superfamily)